MTDLILLQERWEIIDPRTTIFRQAFHHAHFELVAAWPPYFEMALRQMPLQLPDGRVVPWNAPDAATYGNIKSLGDAMRRGYDLHRCYIGDLQVEMQNLLLGELFEPHIVPRRSSPDPNYRAVRLDRISELEIFFANTPSGRMRTKVEAEAEARFPDRSHR